MLWCARLPRALAIDVELFARGGLAILDAIEARGFDVLSGRPSLSRSTKLRLIASAAAVQGMNSIDTSYLFAVGSMRLAAATSNARDDRSFIVLAVTVSHTGLEDSR